MEHEVTRSLGDRRWVCSVSRGRAVHTCGPRLTQNRVDFSPRGSTSTFLEKRAAFPTRSARSPTRKSSSKRLGPLDGSLDRQIPEYLLSTRVPAEIPKREDNEGQNKRAKVLSNSLTAARDTGDANRPWEGSQCLRLNVCIVQRPVRILIGTLETGKQVCSSIPNGSSESLRLITRERRTTS